MGNSGRQQDAVVYTHRRHPGPPIHFILSESELYRQRITHTCAIMKRASVCSSLDLARGLSRKGYEQNEKGPSLDAYTV